ncbi:hypothetical protein ICW40_03735 [Actinotalea ferrariae]|uniref:hypothetical protein n=1 Tax=Actinotalea ferrariae TaxID=1386098 RepID=UPI001C8CDC88|nr:hypothetical protein [Actinotalea ferrariae]MBX9243917.1 hypothetical protein [Actinotalea ferrariae]
MTSPPGTGVRPPAPPAPPTRSDPEAVRRAHRQVMHFGLLVLATIVVAPLALPGQVASLLLAVAAVVVGIRALLAVVRAGMRGVLVPLLGLGLGFALIMVLSLATMLALWPLQEELRQCLGDALTIAAQDQCQVEFQRSLEERLGAPTG